MTNVPMAEAKDRLSHYAAAAVAGEDVVITRHGKPYVRIVAAEADRMARQREAVAGLAAIGDQVRAAGRGVSIEQIIEWINEDRR